MKINPSSQVRLALYILIALGTPVTAYLLSKGYIGELEVSFWSGLVAVISAMAGLNIQKQ